MGERVRQRELLPAQPPGLWGGNFRSRRHLFADGLSPGWYILEAEAGGYLTGRTVAFEITQGSAVTRNIILSQPGETLAKLLPQMETLREGIAQTMLFETELMAELTEVATDDIEMDSTDEIWSALSLFGDALDNPAQAFADYGSTLVINRAISRGVDALVPYTGLEVWTSEELQHPAPEPEDWPWSVGETLLSGYHTDYASAGNLTAVPAFDFERAARMISGQSKAVEDIRRGNITLIIPLADPDDEYVAASLPAAFNTYLLASNDIRTISFAGKALTVVKVVAGGAAVFFSGGTAAGAVYAGAKIADSIVGKAEFVAKVRAGFVFASGAKAWASDTTTLPGVYKSAADLLRREAAAPVYLDSSKTYSATATVDMYADPQYPGMNLIPITGGFGVERSAPKQATVHVTNTGNTISPIRVRVTAFCDHAIHGGPATRVWQSVFGGGRIIHTPTNSSYDMVPLDPGQSHSFTVTYLAFGGDILKDRWLEIDVYSGPFLCKTIPQSFVIGQPVSQPASFEADGQTVTVNLATKAAFETDGERHVMGEPEFIQMMPVVSTVGSGAIDTTNTLLSYTWTTGAETWSVAFRLYGDPAAEIALQVYDQAGACVGNVPSKGGKVVEFAAEYNGPQARPQVVEIPDAAGKTFTVRAVLVGSDSQGPFDVEIYATEIPIRPAVLAVTPSEFLVVTRAGYDVNVPVILYEAGEQQPLADASVYPGIGLISSDGANALAPESGGSTALGTLAAGSTELVEVVYGVPMDVAPGHYTGQITVTSSNAGSQSIPVSVIVPPLGDANGDCVVNILDLIWVRNRLGADVATGDNWKADVNSDGKINILDLLAVRNNLSAKCEE